MSRIIACIQNLIKYVPNKGGVSKWGHLALLSSTPEAKNPRATAAKPAGLKTSARQGLAMVAQWFHRWAEAEGVDGLPPN